MLKTFIKEILFEIRKKPESVDLLYNRLKKEIENYLNSDKVSSRFIENEKNRMGNIDFEKIKHFAEMDKKYFFDIQKHEHWIIIQLSLRYLNIELENVNNFYEYEDKSEDEVIAKIKNLVTTISPKYGWTLNTIKDTKQRIYIAIEPNYGKREKIKKQKLYHLCKLENVESILRKGLIPKDPVSKSTNEKGRKYPPRVYVTTTLKLANQLEDAFCSEDLADAMAFGDKIYRSYIVLEIDPDKLLPGTKFYVDQEIVPPEFGSNEQEAYWTYSRIPADAIKVESSETDEWNAWVSGRDKDEKFWKEYNS